MQPLRCLPCCKAHSDTCQDICSLDWSELGLLVGCCPVFAVLYAYVGYWECVDTLKKRRRAEARTVKPLAARTGRAARISLDSTASSNTEENGNYQGSGFKKILPMRYANKSKSQSISKLISKAKSKTKTVHSQSTSPLFRLPFELRELIYAHLLADFAIYLIKRSAVPPSNLLRSVPPAKMRHVRYKHNRDARSRCFVSMSSHGWIAHYIHDRERPARPAFEGEGGSLVDVLLSCRRVYSEAVDMVYARNVFHFFYVEDLADFMGAVPGRRMARVTCVTLHYWAEMEWLSRGMVGLVRGLGGLRRLEIKVEGPWGEEGGLVEMIGRVREGVMVEVELRRCTEGMLRRLGECKRENLRIVNSSNVRLKNEND